MMELFTDAIHWIKYGDHGELDYIFLIVVLFIVPRIFLKYGVPMALTAFGIGIFVNMGLEVFREDQVISLFSTLGIISLFLFAGLEVDLKEVIKSIKLLIGHISVRILVLAFLASIFSDIYEIPVVVAIMLSLALATPSTGFILDSIEMGNLSDNQKYWIKIKSIAAELVALGMLLFFSQMQSVTRLIGSFVIIILLILVLPYVLKKIGQGIEKIAPGSDFSFIFMLAIISGIITKYLGAYYLVGAFIVGMATGQFKRNFPIDSKERKSAKSMLNSLKSFSSFFMPFYFFQSGLRMPKDAFAGEAVKVALLLIAISLPIKVISILAHRRFSIVESWKDSFAISISLMPNLVFGLILAEILHTKMGLSVTMYGGLIIYTLVVTMMAPLILKLMPNTLAIASITQGPND